MARISVVVPIYNVEPFLDACLRSVAGQSFGDLEVVMVDDGSTDGSAAIAERFAARDGRFRLIAQPNAGLGAARNTGIAAASGDHLAFLDSDDELPHDAYERLLRSLERTGSDFATGNVHRLSSRGTTQAAFLAQAFARSRARAHVRAHAELLSDRTACNKLWRRSFWDGLGLRFPEGRLHEDIALVLRAHYAAEAVDVIAAPVYHYRVRETGEPSITQRRHELPALVDRLAAVEEIHDHLTRTEAAKQRRRYERSVIAADLRYHLDLLPEAGDEYRALFLERANAFLDSAHGRVCDGLPALERLKWELVRRRALPELLETLRFQREDTLRTPPVRRLGRCYGDFPFRDDRGLRLPRSAYRLGRRDPELSLTAHLEDLRVDGGVLRLAGHAYVNALGAGGPESQRVSIAAVQPGRLRAVRLRVASRRFPTRPAKRPDLEPDLAWSGFSTAIRTRDVAAGDGDQQRWDVFAYVRTGWIRRRRARFEIDRPLTLDLPAGGGALVRATATPGGAVAVTVHRSWLRIEAHRMVDGPAVELSGTVAGAARELRLVRAADRLTVSREIEVDDGAFTVAIPLAALRSGPDEARRGGEEAEWRLACTSAGRALPVVIDAPVDGSRWRSDACELSIAHSHAGAPLLTERELRPVPVPAASPEPRPVQDAVSAGSAA